MRHRLSTGLTGPERASDRSMMKIHFLLYGVALALPGAAMAQAHLPATGARPLEIDFSSDPVLALGARHAPLSQLRSAVLQVLASNPLMAEARARQDEASAVIDEARDRIGPSATASVQSYRVIARKFDTGDTGNLVERTRPLQRTDALLQIEQRVFDFGASSARLRSAEARAQAAGADAVRTRSTLTLEFISTWYEVTSYRALIEVIDAFLASERDLREAVRRRIAAGASAEIERTQMDALFAAANARRARAVRSLGIAEAQFRAQSGSPPAPGLQRPPTINAATAAAGFLDGDARSSPQVRGAEALAKAAQAEARAARADRLPSITTGVDAGRYGVLEQQPDYDIRARVTLRAPLFGGGLSARADQAEARARGAQAVADRVRRDAERDVRIAMGDVAALEAQLTALEGSYRAARISRDAVAARFIGQRGTINDVAVAESDFVAAATAYIQGLGELDAARYAVLAETGQLLAQLGIAESGREVGDGQ